MNESEIPAEFIDLMEDVWDSCVSLIAVGTHYPAYVGCLQTKYAALSARERELLAWPAMLSLARVAWRRTPQPRLNYALDALPAPQRNAPCACGSGRKYKHCCLSLEQATPADLNDLSLLPTLLERLPRKRWQELAGSRISVDMLGHTAFQWREEGRAKDVCTLLEPWFVADADFHARREALFDALLDAYTDLERPRKKAQLLDRALAVGDRRIRSAAMQRRATMLADQGNYKAAWQLFGEAQRADPQSASLSHLEITLLLSEGRHAEARERARFWVHRLSAMRDADLQGVIDFMRDIADNGAAAMQGVLYEHEPVFDELADLLQQAPPVAVQYTLEPSADAAGPLHPKPALRKALKAWFAATGAEQWIMPDPGDDDIEAWLPVLRAQPQLWNAFEVLDTLVDAIRERISDAFAEGITQPLLARGEQLLHEVLRANHAEGKTLEWGWVENRPALSLLGARIVSLGKGGDDPAQLERLEWLVGTLNPNDNQGFRHALVRAYLRAGRAADALAVCQRYPDDLAAMQYNHALVLYALNERDKALTALQSAVDDSPKLLAWLLKDKPRPPRLDPIGFTLGGDDEAWFYRQETLSLWEQLGALDWLRASAKALRKRG